MNTNDTNNANDIYAITIQRKWYNLRAGSVCVIFEPEEGLRELDRRIELYITPGQYAHFDGYDDRHLFEALEDYTWDAKLANLWNEHAHSGDLEQEAAGEIWCEYADEVNKIVKSAETADDKATLLGVLQAHCGYLYSDEAPDAVKIITNRDKNELIQKLNEDGEYANATTEEWLEFDSNLADKVKEV